MIADRSVLTTGVGAWRTQSLYLETNRSGLDPVMTLKEVDWEHKGKMLPSLHRIYMELSDPTEYSVAMEVFGSWYGWERQMGNDAIMEHIEAWRVELEIKLRSTAIMTLIDISQEKDSKSVSAAKYIADKGWIKRKAGAPSAAEKAGELEKQGRIVGTLQGDAKRLGLVK